MELGITKREFVKRVSIDESGCWLWKGGKDKKGYGIIILKGRRRSAHAIAYLLWKEPYPYGLVVRHECDRPTCCNPKHLIIGTVKDNLDDMRKRFRDPYHFGRSKCRIHWRLVPIIQAVYESGETKKDISIFLGVSDTIVSQIIAGTHWSNRYYKEFSAGINLD